MYNDYESPDGTTDLDRRALLAQMAGAPMKEEGGITGGQAAKDVKEQNADPAAQAAKDYSSYRNIGDYKDRFGTRNGNEKFNTPWDDMSERYQMLTVLSHFDPNQGLTPEAIDALNNAGIKGGAKFSGSRDKLNVDNVNGYDRFGHGGTGDIIEKFNDPNNKQKNWGAWQVDDNPQAGGQQPGAGAGAPIQGPDMGQMQSLAPSDMGTYNTLQERLKQILGGPEAFDRDALMKLMAR